MLILIALTVIFGIAELIYTWLRGNTPKSEEYCPNCGYYCTGKSAFCTKKDCEAFESVQQDYIDIGLLHILEQLHKACKEHSKESSNTPQ